MTGGGGRLRRDDSQNQRPERYGSKRSPAEALQELWREAGRQFDVRVVEAMGRLLGDPKTSSTDTPRPH